MRNGSSNAKPWTSADEALLMQLAGEGKFIPEIAKCLGRSQQAVLGRAQKLNLSLRSAAARRYPPTRASRAKAKVTTNTEARSSKT